MIETYQILYFGTGNHGKMLHKEQNDTSCTAKIPWESDGWRYGKELTTLWCQLTACRKSSSGAQQVEIILSLKPA